MADEPDAAPNRMRWLTGGCTVLLFLCIGASAVAWWHAGGLLKACNPFVNRQLELMEKGDWAGAYDLMAPEFEDRSPALVGRGLAPNGAKIRTQNKKPSSADQSVCHRRIGGGG